MRRPLWIRTRKAYIRTIQLLNEQNKQERARTENAQAHIKALERQVRALEESTHALKLRNKQIIADRITVFADKYGGGLN